MSLKQLEQTRFYAESNCDAKHASGKHEGEQCTNKAYYLQQGRYVCGVHSKEGKRTKLKKNPRAKENKQNRIKTHQESVDAATEKNRKESRAGQVICSKIGMMTRPDDVPGYLKVFPNYKHQNRADGFGCASLSPMNLGPVEHHQKGLPICKLLENYHQFNKVYDCELDNHKKPKKNFYTLQNNAYRSNKGQRHKYKGKMVIGGVLRRPRTLYCVHVDSDGNLKNYDYMQSRYFYCYFYEKLAKDQADLASLKSMLQKGTNLQIVGYDGYPVRKDLMYHYTDTSKPFGHEMVLYSLLTITNQRDYPWNKYYEMFGKDLYPKHLTPHYLKEKHTKCTDMEVDTQRSSGSNIKKSKSSNKKQDTGSIECVEISESSPEHENEDACIEEYETD